MGRNLSFTANTFWGENIVNFGTSIRARMSYSEIKKETDLLSFLWLNVVNVRELGSIIIFIIAVMYSPLSQPLFYCNLRPYGIIYLIKTRCIFGIVNQHVATWLMVLCLRKLKWFTWYSPYIICFSIVIFYINMKSFMLELNHGRNFTTVMLSMK